MTTKHTHSTGDRANLGMVEIRHIAHDVARPAAKQQPLTARDVAKLSADARRLQINRDLFEGVHLLEVEIGRVEEIKTTVTPLVPTREGIGTIVDLLRVPHDREDHGNTKDNDVVLAEYYVFASDSDGDRGNIIITPMKHTA